MSSPPEQKTSLQIYLRLLTHVRPFIGAFAVSIVGYLIYASAQPMLASVLKYFVDGLSSPDGLNQLTLPLVGPVELMYGIPVLVVLISSWQGLGSFLGSYFLAKVSLGLVDRLRRALFESLLRLPNTYFDQHNSGHLISRINYDATMVTGAATEAVKVVIREGFIVIALFGYLLWMNWKLTLVMVAILPIIGVMVGKASKRFRKQSRKIQASMGDVTHVASEIIQGYRVVRSFGGEDYESARFGRAITRNTASQLKMVRTSASFTPALPRSLPARRRDRRRPGGLPHRRRIAAQTHSPTLGNKQHHTERTRRGRADLRATRRGSRNRSRHLRNGSCQRAHRSPRPQLHLPGERCACPEES
jgi:subfamily B ATP-binding cassette protein MsbA